MCIYGTRKLIQIVNQRKRVVNVGGKEYFKKSNTDMDTPTTQRDLMGS